MAHLRTFKVLLLGIAALLPAWCSIEVNLETRRLKPFQATRVVVLMDQWDPMTRPWEWDVQPPGAGRFSQPGGRGAECMFMAGDTQVPLEIQIRVRPAGSLPDTPWTATAKARVEPAPYRIGTRAQTGEPLGFGPVTLTAGEARHLEVAGPSEPGADLVWTIAGPQGGSFARATGRTNTFRASTRILEARLFHIAVTDRGTGEASYLEVFIRPKLPKGPPAVTGAHVGANTLMAHQMGLGWDLPSLTLVSRPASDPYTGGPRTKRWDTAYRRWDDVRSVCWMEGPLPESRGGCWLIADGAGLSRMAPDGGATRMVLHGRLTEAESDYDLRDCVFERLASRPAGSGQHVPRVVAVVSRREATRSQDGYLTMPRQYVCIIEPQGTVRPLAGRKRVPADDEGDQRLLDRVVYTGRAGQVDFRAVSGLCLDPAGNVYVTDQRTWAPPAWGTYQARMYSAIDSFGGGLRRIDPQGNVTALASPSAEMETKALALRRPVSLAYEPGQGRLLLVDAGSLIRFDPVEGAWDTPLGKGRLREEAPLGDSMRFSLDGNQGLVSHRGYVFFVQNSYGGMGSLWAYDPRSDRLAELTGQPEFERVGWGSHQGPLSLYAPGVPASERAQLNGPSALALHGTKALVPLLDGLGMVHLDSDPFGTYLDAADWRRPGESKEGKEPASAGSSQSSGTVSGQ